MSISTNSVELYGITLKCSTSLCYTVVAPPKGGVE